MAKYRILPSKLKPTKVMVYDSAGRVVAGPITKTEAKKYK